MGSVQPEIDELFDDWVGDRQVQNGPESPVVTGQGLPEIPSCHRQITMPEVRIGVVKVGGGHPFFESF